MLSDVGLIRLLKYLEFLISLLSQILHVVWRIFDSSIHSYQSQSIAIFKDLWKFFNKHSNNLVEFWDCSSNKDWHLHTQVDKKTKKFNLISLYSSKMSWDFSKKKKKCNNIIKEWHYEFKTLNLKGKFFLKLLNNDLLDIKPSYMKGGSWIKNLRFSNSLCA